MEPLSALSVAAAVVQFVDFGTRLLDVSWDVYKGASGSREPPNLLPIISADLETFTEPLRNMISRPVPDHPTAQDSQLATTDSELRRVCQDCDDISKDIRKALPKTCRLLEHTAPTKELGRAFQVGLEQVWNRGKIDNLRSRLSEVRKRAVELQITSIWWVTQRSCRTQEPCQLTPVARLECRGSREWQKGLISMVTDTRTQLSGARHQAQAIGPIGDAPSHDLVGLFETLVDRPKKQKIARALFDRYWKPDDQLRQEHAEAASHLMHLNNIVVNSLEYKTMYKRQDAIATPFQSTYGWILSRKSFTLRSGETVKSGIPDWLDSADETRHPFWITGKPGSGKSTAMKFISQHESTNDGLLAWAGSYPVCILNYFAWKPGILLAKSMDGLIRTILYQFLKKYPNLVLDLCPRRWYYHYLLHGTTAMAFMEEEPQEWSSWELRESLEALLNYSESRLRFAIFVDGLDEFETEDDPNALQGSDNSLDELASLIHSLAQRSCCKVCVASRPWQQFRDSFRDSPKLHMHELTERDIATYVNGKIKALPAFEELGPDHCEINKLIDEVIFDAHGVFLWVTLVTKTLVQELNEGASLQQLWKILNRMPQEIKKLYDVIYGTIPDHLRPHSAAMLQITNVVAAIGNDAALCTTVCLADEARETREDVIASYLSHDRE